jgi:acetolactate decarboxylase
MFVTIASGLHALALAGEDGVVEYQGAQRTIFATGRADAALTVAGMTRCAGAMGVGAVAQLDGEVTVLDGRAYVSRVRGDRQAMDHAPDTGVIFAAWSCQAAWRDEPIPPTLNGYVDLQTYVRERALAAGIDVTQGFPFRISGTPRVVKWHINVDRTAGRPITQSLFAESKAGYVARNEAMDIVGFYAEHRGGVYISAYAPAIPEGGAARNALHMHMVTRDRKAAGHIDDIEPGGGLVLSLPDR